MPAINSEQSQVPKEASPVFTATRAYKTLTDVAPFIVTATTTVTWTYVPWILGIFLTDRVPARAPALSSQDPPAPGFDLINSGIVAEGVFRALSLPLFNFAFELH